MRKYGLVWKDEGRYEGRAILVEWSVCSSSFPLSINIGLCSYLRSQFLIHIASSDTHFRSLYAASRS